MQLQFVNAPAPCHPSHHAISNVFQNVEQVHVIWNAVHLVKVMPMNPAMVVPPAGLLEAGQEVGVESVYVRKFVVIVLASGFSQLGLKERQRLHDVADVLAAGRKQCGF